MRKLIASTAIAAALLLPGTAAVAGPPVGAAMCPTGDVGIIIWALDSNGQRYELVRACWLIAP